MKLLAALAIALLFTAGISSQASAQTYEPQGSWQMSCRNPHMQGSTFRAQCRRDDDSWSRSSIDVNQCPSGMIANINGTLACEGNGYRGNYQRGSNQWNANNRLPGGSWSMSCRNASMRGNALSASCQDGRGDYLTSSVDMTRCAQNLFANNNGYLVCEGYQR
jgi:hypothetical protein